MVKVECGVPSVGLKTLTAITDKKVSIDWLEWAPDSLNDYGTAKRTAQATEITSKKFTPPDGEGSPLLTQEFATRANHWKDPAGTMPVLGTKKVDDIVKAITAQR